MKIALPIITIGWRARADRFGDTAMRSGSSAVRGLRGVMRIGSSCGAVKAAALRVLAGFAAAAAPGAALAAVPDGGADRGLAVVAAASFVAPVAPGPMEGAEAARLEGGVGGI
ncbi:MAG: hypothetical protein HXY30_19145 [Pseudorhodoplanes sp.]|nr:hypothetical protein [Pseudorhodoplanes sp.]